MILYKVVAAGSDTLQPSLHDAEVSEIPAYITSKSASAMHKIIEMRT